MTLLTQRAGFWSAACEVVLGLAYIASIGAILISGKGFPPSEPYQTIISVISLFSAPLMVFTWSVVHIVVPAEKKIFSMSSLALIIIFATLTSINRYVSMTVIPQSYILGKTDGLEWFLPYGWPSIMAAIEVLAWGFFLGLACLCLAPVFRIGKLEQSIFWILVVTGILSLVATFGQVINSKPLNVAGILAWGPGLTTALVLLAIWFRRGA